MAQAISINVPLTALPSFKSVSAPEAEAIADIRGLVSTSKTRQVKTLMKKMGALSAAAKDNGHSRSFLGALAQLAWTDDRAAGRLWNLLTRVEATEYDDLHRLSARLVPLTGHSLPTAQRILSGVVRDLGA